jgi:hypothetical protein
MYKELGGFFVVILGEKNAEISVNVCAADWALF